MLRQAVWCERGELNPHGYPLDSKSSASTSSATLARIAHKGRSITRIGENRKAERRETPAGEGQGRLKGETPGIASRQGRGARRRADGGGPAGPYSPYSFNLR